MSLAPLDADAFAGLLAPLGPFGRAPRLAVAVSGGADSMALALLAAGFAATRGGTVLALVVDHRLRAASADEARLTIECLAAQGIAAQLLRLDGLARGPALAARARAARYAALEAACRAAGIVHLLLGHHAGDQAETILMRRSRASGADGLAGMAAIVERDTLLLIRPLLAIPPGRLRATLVEAGQGWVEDPSNRDPASTRARLRRLLDDQDGVGPGTVGLLAGAAAAGAARARRDAQAAATLGALVRFHPEGFAVLPAAMPPAALTALLRAIAGRTYPLPMRQVIRLAAALRPATLGGVRLLAAGRLGDGLLAVREAAAMSGPVPAAPGAIWDGRFRLGWAAQPPPGATLGAVGADAARLRRASPLPAVVLATLPAIRCAGVLVAVPHLEYPDAGTCCLVPIRFAPAEPASGAGFAAALGDAERRTAPYVEWHRGTGALFRTVGQEG